MTYFLKKTPELCLNEIKAASDYVNQMFNSEINLARLKYQIEQLVNDKVDKYYYERFKDWTVADLILLTQTIEQKIEEENKSDKKTKNNK